MKPLGNEKNESLSHVVAAAYGLPGSPLLVALTTGTKPVYRMHFEGHTLILALYPKSDFSAERLQTIHAWQASLAGEGCRVAVPLIDNQGNDVVAIEFKGLSYWAAVTSYVGEFAPTLDVAVAETLGEELAKMHEVTPESGASNDHGLEVLDERGLLFESIDEILPRLGNDIRARQIIEQSKGLMMTELDRIPRDDCRFGACHGDAHHLNARRSMDGTLCFFDFDLARTTWRMYDLATLIWGSLSADVGANEEPLWTAFVRGYSRVRPLTEEERTALGAFVAVRQLWWVAFHARHWGTWKREWLNDAFFSRSIELYGDILKDAYGFDLQLNDSDVAA